MIQYYLSVKEFFYEYTVRRGSYMCTRRNLAANSVKRPIAPHPTPHTYIDTRAHTQGLVYIVRQLANHINPYENLIGRIMMSRRFRPSRFFRVSSRKFPTDGFK